MLTKFKSLLNRQFQGESGNVFRGMLTLVMGAGLARIVGLASIPILTRLYSPEDYGVLAIYTSIVAVLVPILTLRYVTAIPLPKTDAMAFNLFMLCAKLILVGTLLISFVLGFFGETVLGWFSMQEFAHLWWLIAIGAMGTATYELFSLWATRKKDYKVIAKTQFTQSLTGNAVKIGLGLLSLKPLGLVIGQLVAQSGGVGGLFKNAYHDFKKLYPSLSTKKQKIVANFYQEFPWFRLPSQFLMALSVQAPILMMSALYDKESTGQLGLAIMALSLPVSLIGGAMSKAYYAEIASLGKYNIKKIKELTFFIQKKLFVVGIPFALLVYLFSEMLFKLFFGDDWAEAGKFASLLAPFVLFQFTSSPLMEAINILSSQIAYLVLHSLRLFGLYGLYLLSSSIELGEDFFIFLLSIYLSVFYLLASLLIIFMLIKKEKG